MALRTNGAVRNLCNLPGYMYCYLKEFLTPSEMNSLLLCSAVLWRMHRYEHYYLRLTHDYALMYHENIECRSKIRALCKNVGRQLSIRLRNISSIFDANAFSGVHCLDLWGCHNITDVSMLGGVHDLNLGLCNEIYDVSGLGHVHSLDL